MSIVENNIARKIMEVGCRIATWLNPIIPKRENIIVFYESTPDYMNNYELMRYMVREGYDKKHRMYYFPNIKEECHLGEEYKRVVFSNNLVLALYLFLTSRVVFLDTGNMRMVPSKKQAVLYMDHGLPFKLAGRMVRTFDRTYPKDLIMPVNYFLSSSKAFDAMYCKAYCLDQKQLLRCGRPRTDAFYKKGIYLNTVGIEKEKYKKIIMWMTTYRITNNGRACDTTDRRWSVTNLPILVDMKKIQAINEYLREKDYLLVIKIHASSIFDEKSIQELSNIRLLLDRDIVSKGVQVYDILKDFDALVTDYSSVFLDFLLVDKPMVFITDDFKDFDRLHGFFFKNPLAIMPGPKVNTYQELIEELSMLDQNERNYKSKRQKLRDICHTYQDGEDSQRVLDLLGIEK